MLDLRQTRGTTILELQVTSLKPEEAKSAGDGGGGLLQEGPASTRD